jgi:hypothetical protein
MLAEECAEVIQAATKTLRHGWESTHPEGSETNREYLVREIKECFVVILGMMHAQGDLDMETSDEELDKLLEKKLRFAHHQE